MLRFLILYLSTAGTTTKTQMKKRMRRILKRRTPRKTKRVRKRMTTKPWGTAVSIGERKLNPVSQNCLGSTTVHDEDIISLLVSHIR